MSSGEKAADEYLAKFGGMLIRPDELTVNQHGYACAYSSPRDAFLAGVSWGIADALKIGWQLYHLIKDNSEFKGDQESLFHMHGAQDLMTVLEQHYVDKEEASGDE